MTDKEINSTNLALTDKDIRDFCNKNSLEFNIVDLAKLDTFNKRFAFIFTGSESNTFNKGNDHHWMFLDGSLIFDSYGKSSEYIFPPSFEMVRNAPRQLQEYGSTVCGEYCCAFYKFIKSSNLTDPDEIGEEFSDAMHFTSNKKANDKIVFNWWEANGGIHNPD